MRIPSLSIAAAITVSLSSAYAQSTTFTYQGQLKDNAQPANGNFDLRFHVFDASTGGNQVAPPLCLDNVSVVDGVFTVALDFGPVFTTTGARYLDIEARRDNGLNCTNTEGFISLSQRQLIASVPFAIHAKSAFALDAADGAPLNAVFVDNLGRVGIGVTNPSAMLTVAGDMNLGLDTTDYHRLRIGGGNSFGFLFGSFPRLGEGIHLGYNYFVDAAGTVQITLPGIGTSRLSLQQGSIVFATAPAGGAEPISRMGIASNGNVGIGTLTAASKLDVRGDIRLGSSGQFLAAASADENLRIARGSVFVPSGGGSISIVSGSGFTPSIIGIGHYRITFSTPFADVPTVTASANSGTCDYIVSVGSTTAGSVELFVTSDPCNNGHAWAGCNFIAVGSR